jgi:hypothetical protein
MRKTLLLAVLAVLGCYKDPESRHTTSNPEIPVGKLFEFDGCTVYRFSDGDTRYFARCDSVARVGWRERRGRVTVPIDIETVDGPRTERAPKPLGTTEHGRRPSPGRIEIPEEQ